MGIIYTDELKSSTKFCHYTSKENAANILNSETLYLSRLDQMNDGDEKNSHLSETNQLFVASFCHSEARSIPLFYLYSGIDGKGCRIEFTDAKLKKMIEEASIFPVNSAMKRMKKSYDQNAYDIYVGWVNYIASSGYYAYKGKEQKRFMDYNSAMIAMMQQNRQYFVKNSIWKYEQEFRIVVKFKKPIDYTHIALKFNVKENDRGISVVVGPENTEDEIKMLKEEFKGYGICKVEPFGDKHISMGLTQKYKKK